jgi:HEAT repeat protein
MRFTMWRFFAVGSPSSNRVLVGFFTLLLTSGLLCVRPGWADGCFVFRWNKKIDINEPTQKAIVVYDAGREDLLLQVKYEGPLEEFGWLIPVPTVPTVQKGSMQPFYELSQLTQRQVGGHYLGTARLGVGGGHAEDSVKVIELKTVGAYEVAVLSAQDAGSLANWLHAHDFSMPEGKSTLVDEYIHKGWFFVAARIQLDREVAFRLVSASSPKDADKPAKARSALQKQLSSGELHPLLLSFDTPQCVFPLKISSVAGKPSEVSLYVLSAEPLVEPFIFAKVVEKFRRQKLEWERHAKQREANAAQSLRNLRSLNLAWQMYSLRNAEKGQRTPRDWSLKDLEALGKESEPNYLPRVAEEDFQFPSEEFLQSFEVKPVQIPQCTQAFPRLKGRGWYLTKQVNKFRPEEMQDLQFQPAVPLLQAALPNPEGNLAAIQLTRYGEAAVPILVAGCKSTNATERAHAALAMQSVKDQRFVEPLLQLLSDQQPAVRYIAMTAAMLNWDERFADPLCASFRDPYPMVRQQATVCLMQLEQPARVPIYVAMLKDPDPNVQACALRVLSLKNRTAIPRAELLRLLSSPQFEVVSQALSLLQRPQPVGSVAFLSAALEARLSSAEAAPLATNRFTMARLMGLKILRQNADATAVELALPLLRDTNSLVRARAFSLLKAVSGLDISQNDPARWDQWWATNKAAFRPR